VRLDGDEVAPDADDGDAGHATAAYMGRHASARADGTTVSLRAAKSSR
jgi:hypothetical protein